MTTKKPVSRSWEYIPPLLEWRASYELQALKWGFPPPAVTAYVLFRKWWPVLFAPVLLVSIRMNNGGKGTDGGLSAMQWIGSVVMAAFLALLNFGGNRFSTVRLTNEGIYIPFGRSSDYYPYESITEYQIVEADWGKSLVFKTEMSPRRSVIIHPGVSLELLEQILSTHINQK
jgi:hypothetical protein